MSTFEAIKLNNNIKENIRKRVFSEVMKINPSDYYKHIAKANDSINYLKCLNGHAETMYYWCFTYITLKNIVKHKFDVKTIKFN